MEESVIDGKGRVVIPQRLRERAGLREGARVRLSVEGGRITIAKPVSPAEFIREMEGCIKEGSPVPRVDPLGLKRIWEKA
jgi:AbrB family looped-hinge helix DNA binding protein